MVERQLRGRGIADKRVLQAMGTVPRELFVEPGMRRRAYDDAALPIAFGQSISQPYVVARMVELLEPMDGQRVLDIGTGSGYGAAVLAAMGCTVVSIERHARLAEGARDRIRQAGKMAAQIEQQPQPQKRQGEAVGQQGGVEVDERQCDQRPHQ